MLWRGPVPKLSHYNSSAQTLCNFSQMDLVKDVSPENWRFYRHWVRNWRRGRAIDLDGNGAYLYTYACESVRSLRGHERRNELLRLDAAYPRLIRADQFLRDVSLWLSHCYVEVGDLAEAYRRLPEVSFELACRGTDFVEEANYRMNLKWHLGLPATSRDVKCCLQVPGVGFHMKDDARFMEEELDGLLDEWRDAHTAPLLAYMAAQPSARVESHMLLFKMGRLDGRDIEPVYAPIKRVAFNKIPEFQDLAKTLGREAENRARRRLGIPAVGEGWVAETSLFHQIRQLLPEYTVVHHAHLPWLGMQHLDIYIEELRVGIEYQGVQHDKPVTIFGGEEGLKKRQEQDERKRRLCEENDCVIIYVHPDFDIREVERAVRTARK